MKTKIYAALAGVLLLCVMAGAKGGAPGRAELKWEHKIIHTHNYVEGSKALAELQGQGWELVTVAAGANLDGGGYYYLKRAQ